MTRRFAALLTGSALVLALGACNNDSTSIETKTEDVNPSFSQGEQGYLGAHVHVMPIKSQAQEAHAARPQRPGSGTGISYHGGPVLNGSRPTRVVAIYWSQSNNIYIGGPTPTSTGATGTANQDGSLVGHFLRSLGGSSYFNINTTYYDGTGAVPNSVEYRGYFADSHNAPSGTTSVSDAQIQAEIVRAFGAYPNDGHTIYVVFSEGKVNLGGGFGTQYCAYHGHFSSGGKDVLFAVQPYNYAYPSACSNGTKSPNDDPGADAEVSTLAHEIEEAATDPNLNAWYDNRGYENADKCAWTWGTTSTASNGGLYNMTLGGKNFLVQRNWINQGSGGCFKGLTSSGTIS
ncbi:MAG TPA: hypothetical protein VJ847_10340 [Gemmatimonadales bacterium]|jgi:hypothetical protein|nr:hypothetical protein [Gemmatimonadales bacterium]